jgi:hypothetical protein
VTFDCVFNWSGTLGLSWFLYFFIKLASDFLSSTYNRLGSDLSIFVDGKFKNLFVFVVALVSGSNYWGSLFNRALIFSKLLMNFI